MDEEAQERFKEIARVYRGPEGGKPAFKTWRDAREINPAITLNEVKAWFKLNVQPKGQVWGKGTAMWPKVPTSNTKPT